MTADIRAGGVTFFAIGAVLALVNTAVSAVLTATHLLVTGVREIWDSVASLGGGSSSIYRIVVKSPRFAECEEVTFTGNTEDAATDVMVRSVSCMEATEFIRGVTGFHNFYSGPRSFTFRGYSCTEELREDGLPYGAYSCEQGAKAIKWEKH